MQRWLSGTMLKDLLPFFGSKISIWAPSPIDEQEKTGFRIREKRVSAYSLTTPTMST